MSHDVRQPLNDEGLEQVLSGAGLPGERDHTLVVLMAGTGLRLNEIRELQVGDLNLRDRQLTVRAETSKFRRSRTVDFHDAVARELGRHLRNRSSLHDDDPVIATDEGRFFTKDGLAKVFQRIRTRSGIRGFSAHILRHTLGNRVHATARSESSRTQAPGWLVHLKPGRAIQPRSSGEGPQPATESAGAPRDTEGRDRGDAKAHGHAGLKRLWSGARERHLREKCPTIREFAGCWGGRIRTFNRLIQSQVSEV